MKNLIWVMTLIMLHFSVTSFAQDACDQAPSQYSCDFYSNCIENNYRCQRTNYRYPMEYGDLFCRQFERRSYQLTYNGKKWMKRTMLCLQKFLYNRFLINGINQITTQAKTCKKISYDAFGSHHQCYIRPTGHMRDGICPLWKDYATIFRTGRPWQSIGTKYSRAVRRQVRQTATSCMAYWVGFRRSKSATNNIPYDKILKDLENIIIRNTETN